MFPGSTLFLDVGTQADLWPGGAWPLLDVAASAEVEALIALGRALEIRAGGVCCAHAEPPPGLPAHCLVGTIGVERVAACASGVPVRVYGVDAAARPQDHGHAVYFATGCAHPIAATPHLAAVFAYLVAGVRDAVVFGAGIELGIARVVDALLAVRVRTHLVLDAAGAVDPAAAQSLIEVWKRRGVDVLTAATVDRLLRRAKPEN